MNDSMQVHNHSIVPEHFKKALKASGVRDGVYLLICDNDPLLLNEAVTFADYINPLNPSEKAQNYKLVMPVKNQITIDAIRDFTAFEASLPAGTETKTMIMHRCDLIRGSSSDVLLKTIEEPSNSSLIILTAGDPLGVSDTLRSRCMTFTFLGSGHDENSASYLNLRSAIESASDAMQLSMAIGSVYSYGVESVIKTFAENVRESTSDAEEKILERAHVLARMGNAQGASAYLVRAFHSLAHWTDAVRSVAIAK